MAGNRRSVPRPLTSEFKICFLAPARGNCVRCRARIVKAGRRLVVVAADIDVEDDGKVTHAATVNDRVDCLIAARRRRTA